MAEVVPGQTRDTSLGPWLSSFGKLASPQAGPYPKEREAKSAQQGEGLGDTSLDVGFMPDDFALDFESFLHDADLLEAPEQGAMPVANLFPDMFTA